MQVLKSNIRTDSEEFKQNEKNFLALMAQYRTAMGEAMQGGGESAPSAARPIATPACGISASPR